MASVSAGEIGNAEERVRMGTTSRFCIHITEDVREDKQDPLQQTHN